MQPRNLTLFRFPAGIISVLQSAFVDDTFAECRLKPVGPMELATQGFVSPMGRDDDRLWLQVGAQFWLTIGTEQRILPTAVVNDHLARRLSDLEAREGRKPGGRTRKRIKDEVVAELLPRAFVCPGRVDVLIDPAMQLVAVDTSSRRVAESAVSEIRRALGSFPALPVNAEVAPRSVMTGWVAGEPLPGGLAIGDTAELRDPVTGGAVVKVSHQELQGEEIAKHLEAGKQVARLELVLEDRIGFVLGEDLVLRRVRLLDAAADDLQRDPAEDLEGELRARAALAAGEVRRVFTVLQQALRLSTAEG